MNATFDTKRFGRYLVYDLKNLWANYGLSLLLLGGIPVIMYLFYYLIGLITNGFANVTPPPTGMRAALFFIGLAVLVISFPVKQYGMLTEKRYGSDWLLIPCSRLEKYVSMLLLALVIVPFLYLILFFGTDALLSLVDPSYGEPLASLRPNELMYGSNAGVYMDGEKVPFALGANGFWFLWTGVIDWMLVFLLGALCFRRRKAAKTIVCLIGLGFIFSILMSLYVQFIGLDYLDMLVDDPERWLNRDLGMYINLLLWIRNIVIIGGLGTAIWFRLKTLKH